MNKFSIPAFVENLVQDEANAKYSKAKLKIYYVGETVDKRVFTKEFSDKLLSTIAYTPVVGFYSISDDDFVGHNNVQHIYGLVPENPTLEYVEDAQTGATFAVTDVLLYTGRPDEIGVVASKIVGKQHSLELDPHTVKYVINRDECGNFKNIEFTEGELIGLSVLGDNDTPAFSGSEFFSAQELPEFITDANQGKYQALFNAMFNVEPTAEEVVTEIYRTLDSQRIYGYICEHKPEDYVVICSDYGIYNRYKMTRGADGELELTFECTVRGRYISDEEIEVLANAKKGPAENFNNGEQTEEGAVAAGAEAGSDNSTASTNTDEDEKNDKSKCGADNDDENNKDEDEEPTSEPVDDNEDEDKHDDEEFEALRSNCERLEELNATLQSNLDTMSATAEQLRTNLESFQTFCKDSLILCYSNLLDADTIQEIAATDYTVEEFAAKLLEAYNITAARVAEDVIFEISNINDNVPDPSYNEFDEAAVVEKYKNRNRGKN